jgi:RNA recognition motif-containing protein
VASRASSERLRGSDGERFVTIFVGNLSYQVKQEDLQEVFAEYGNVKKVVVPTDRETGRVRGFALVDMASQEQEEKAIQLDGAEWMGRQMRVNKAKPKEEASLSRAGGERSRF